MASRTRTKKAGTAAKRRSGNAKRARTKEADSAAQRPSGNAPQGVAAARDGVEAQGERSEIQQQLILHSANGPVFPHRPCVYP